MASSSNWLARPMPQTLNEAFPEVCTKTLCMKQPVELQEQVMAHESHKYHEKFGGTAFTDAILVY